MEKWTNKKQIYNGKVVSLTVGEASLGDGSTAHREVINHSGGVGVVPVIGDNVIMVKQYRLAVEKIVLEIPAGKIDPGERPEECARRELEEETGYVAGRLVPVGAFYPSVGYTDEIIYLYLGFDLKETNQKLDSDERIETVRMSMDELRGKLAARELVDSKTIIGLRELFAYMGGANNPR